MSATKKVCNIAITYFTKDSYPMDIPSGSNPHYKALYMFLKCSTESLSRTCTLGFFSR